VHEEDEVDFATLINDESIQIQMAVSRAAEEIKAGINDATASRKPDFTLRALVEYFVNGDPGHDLEVTMLTTCATIVGHLTSSVRWVDAVREQMYQKFDFEPQDAEHLAHLLVSSGMRDPMRDAYGGITRYFLLDATVYPLGADRSARLPSRPWVVQAQHVVGWTLGDSASPAIQ
jgi:hypothetical protein